MLEGNFYHGIAWETAWPYCWPVFVAAEGCESPRLEWIQSWPLLLQNLGCCHQTMEAPNGQGKCSQITGLMAGTKQTHYHRCLVSVSAFFHHISNIFFWNHVSRSLFMANMSRSLVDVWIIKHQGWAASWTEDHWYWNSAVCGEFQLHSSSAFCVLLSGDLQCESCFSWVLPTWMDEASNCIGPAHGGLREAVAPTEAGSTESGYWNRSQFGRERNSRYNTVLAKEANATSPGVQVVGEGKARIGSGADIYLETQSAAQAISFPCSQRAI